MINIIQWSRKKLKISRLPRIGGSEDFNKTVQIFRQLGDNSHVIYLSTGSKIYAVERLVSDSVPDIKKSILRNAKKFGSNAVLLDLPNYPSNKEFTFLDDFADITGSGITILDVSTKGSKSWVYDGKLNSIRESSSVPVLGLNWLDLVAVFDYLNYEEPILLKIEKSYKILIMANNLHSFYKKKFSIDT